MKFQIGDCVIINDCDRPCGDLVAVVTGVIGENPEYYSVSYLNANSRLDGYQNMQATLNLATKLEDFGVELVADDCGEYYVLIMRASLAKYPDGQPRSWQEKFPVKYRYRPDVLKFIAEVQNETPPS